MTDLRRSEDLQFAELVVAQGLCSKEKVDECLSFIARLAAEGVTPPRLGELLARRGYLSASHVEATLKPSGTRVATDAPALPPEAEAAAADPASLVGKYVKVARLGAGGMGEVCRAWDRDLRRWVALKFLHYDDAGQTARFRREAQTAASLNHPNIAAVYEVGESAGKPFIAMQLVQGGTLASLPQDDVRRVVSLVRDAALAVHYAHEQGVIHRDLKPSNLMLEGTRVYVMDFGLAKPASIDSSLSIAGSVLGTPAYMPPEQARGESARVGPRSDVYALGATLYDLLSGAPPFTDSEVYALLKKVVEEEPVPLRRRNPRLSRELETIVMKCLEKDPERRYASARELADDLGRWLGGEAILAHPPSPAYRLRKFVVRHKAIVALAATALLAVGVLLPIWLGERSEKKQLGELAERRIKMLMIKEWTRQAFRTPREIRAAQEGEIARVSEFIGRHPRLPQGYYVRAQGLLMLHRLPQAEGDLRQCLRLQPGFAPAWSLLGRLKLDEYDAHLGGDTTQEILANRIAGRPFLLEALEALKNGMKDGADAMAVERWGLSRTPDDRVAERLAQALSEFYLEGKQEQANRRLHEAFEEGPSEEYCRWLIFWNSGEESARWIERTIQVAPHSTQGYQIRANRRHEAGDHEGAMADFAAALAISPDDASLFAGRAALWTRMRDYDKAMVDCTRAIALDPSFAAAWITRSAIHLKRRDFDSAERDATEALRLHPGHPYPLANRAGARVEKRDFAGAIADASAAIALAPELSLGWSNRAAAFLQKGDLEGASADLAKLFTFNPVPPEAYVTRAAVRLSRGDADGVIEDATTALKLDPTLAMAHANRAGGRLAKGDWDGAIGDSVRALELAPELSIARLNRAHALLRKGDADAALEDLNAVIEREPAQVLAWVNRAAAHLFRNEWDEAFRDASRAVELDPKMAMAWGNRASARFERGEWKEAVADAKKAVELDPKQPVTHVVLALSRYELRELDAAIAGLEQALRVAPAGWPQREEVEEKLKKFREEKKGM